jgi:hypothetical protein
MEPNIGVLLSVTGGCKRLQIIIGTGVGAVKGIPTTKDPEVVAREEVIC